MRRALIRGEHELLGRDTYTTLTEAEERAECQQDLGDLPRPTANAYFSVEVYRNASGLSASDWVNTPRESGYVFSAHWKVEPLAIVGGDAVKLVGDNANADTQAVAIRVDDRIYVLTSWTRPAPHRFEEIASTFRTLPRQPLPPATPTTPPMARRQAAAALAQELARAFAARDVDAVARLMPACHLGVSPVIDGGALANSGGGGLSRSVALFTEALRARFAAGDLSVSVDPALLSDGDPDAARYYYVRSDWREHDRTTRVDLLLDERDGRWQWTSARHHYTRAQLGSTPCIPYRTPWVSGARC